MSDASNESFNDLRRDYQAIEAPAGLRGRILSRLPQQHRWPRAWIPVAVAASLVAAVALVVWSPPKEDAPLVVARLSHTPSVSLLSEVMAERPPLTAPSTTGLRSVPLPALPARPRIPPAPPRAPETTRQY